MTYGEAYRTPTILATDTYVQVSPTTTQRGNEHGFDIRNSARQVVNTVAPVEPEIDRTWEVGYMGVLGDRFSADVTVYRAKMARFLTNAVTIANPFGASPTFAFDGVTGERVNDANGNALVTQTTLNVGEGISDGLEAGLRYDLTRHVAASLNTGLIRLDTIKRNATDPPDATSFNTSSSRTSLRWRPPNFRRTHRARSRSLREATRSGPAWNGDGFRPTRRSICRPAIVYQPGTRRSHCRR